MFIRLFMVLTIVSAGAQGQSAKQFRTPVGRTRPARHLEWRNADAVTTAGEVCEHAGADA